MFYRTLTVAVTDLGLAQVAIALGGGAITHSRPGGHGEVVVTYTTPEAPGQA